MSKGIVVGVVGIAVLGSSVFVACGRDNTAGRSESSSAPNTFVLSEFTVIPPTNALSRGRVTFTADNVGGEVHELVIVRADSVGALPTKPDGSLDERKIAKADKLGEIADLAAGAQATKTLNFSPGTYVAFCNIVDEMMKHSEMSSENGHMHFAEGMHVSFTVT